MVINVNSKFKIHYFRSLFFILYSLFLLLILLLPKISSASVLSDLANSMQPGTWAELQTNGLTKEFLVTDNITNSIFQYADSASWDPVSRQIFFLGSPTGGRPSKFIIYRESDNSWRAGPLPLSGMRGGHAYDHNTIDPSVGEVYWRTLSGKIIYKYSIATDQWSSLPEFSVSDTGCCGIVKHFPEMGRLIFIGVPNKGVIYSFNKMTNQWSGPAAISDMSYRYQPSGQYNPVHKVLLFGGGNSDQSEIFPDLWKIDTAGNVIRLKDTPFADGIGVRKSIVTVDPVSGKYLIFKSSGQFYEYDITTETWKLQGSCQGAPCLGRPFPFYAPGDGQTMDMIEVPIPEYGVNLFVRFYDSRQPAVYLYKHSAGGGTPVVSDTIPPTTPTGLTATAISSSQIFLSWTASTDNVGVIGYRIYRGITQIGTSATNSYSDTGLSANTTYSYTISAYDAAGNVSAQSTSASATTQAAPPSPTGGIVASYSFNEASGTTLTDSSGNSNTGTLTNGPTWTTLGRYSNALSFDGTNDYVNIPNSTSLNISSNAITIEAWIYPQSGSSDSVVLSKAYTDGSMNSPYYQYGIEIDRNGGNQADFIFSTGSGTLQSLSMNQAVTYNQWNHIAFTYDGATIRAYLNGNAAGSSSATGNITARSTPLRIGVDSALSQPYATRVDEVRIYNRALTQSEIQTDMNTPIGGTPPPTDTQAPSIPTNFSAAAISSSQINLSWTASTDNVGVTGYRLERCQGSTCTNFSQISTPTATSYSDTGLSANTTYRYQVRAQDAAGNLSGYSSIVSATTQASGGSSGDADFQARCSTPGVIKCFGFDTQAQIDPFITHRTEVADTAIKASGGASLRFTINSNTGEGAAGYFTQNFSDDLQAQFGLNEEFYVQWRQRFSTELLTTHYEPYPETAFKQAMIDEGDRPGYVTPSCTEMEIVVVNAKQRGIPQMYHSCATYEPLYTYEPSISDYYLQNAVKCEWNNGAGPYGPPCVQYKPDQWMTFQLHVKIGPAWTTDTANKQYNSTIQLWVAEEGQPSKLVIDFSPESGYPWYLMNYNASQSKYGKIWLLPFMTNKDSTQVHPTAYAWYDELIISRNRIADPGAGNIDTTPPAAPSGVTVN